MSEVRDTRIVQYFHECPNGIQVICNKQQVLKRSWALTIITIGIDGTYWDDVPGTAQCPPCPTGNEPKEKYYGFCCFKVALVRIWSKASAPGPVGELVGKPLSFFDLLRETPTITVPVLAYVQTECMVLNGDAALLGPRRSEKRLRIIEETS